MSDPNEAQIAHRESVLNQFAREARQKYDRGQREHGGNLWERTDLIDRLIEEAIDHVFYLYSLREQLGHVYGYVPPVPALQEAYAHNGHLPSHEARSGPDGEP